MGSRGFVADEHDMRDHAAVQGLVESGRMAALGELTAGTAHEINNPLFAILTLVDLLLRDTERGTKAFERLQLVEGSAKDIQAVVERVQRFAREPAGEAGSVALEDAARAAADLVLRVSGTRSVEVVEHFVGGPGLVAGDAARLKCLFVHLLANALRAMPNGGVVTIRIEREGGEVVARVHDGGPGIPPADAERVFELFYTTGNGSGRRPGLGLAAARAIAELHGGTLAIDADVDRGACLVLRLPEISE